ncbi:FAD-dependent oxidoreductase [Nocardioides sp. CN2-186]|uniref:NAD(P)/FAD-dependent oxidoreductase n=1 Tax=Nocardioides tweenelious TaxID=3156607 RepID=UPI0032B37379
MHFGQVQTWSLTGFGSSAHDAASRSYWMTDALSTASRAEAADPLSSSDRADVCIVGGGFTGLWTAIELKRREPTLNVVLLEANQCGSGSSGANAGMLMNLWPKLPTLLKVGGRDEGLDIARASVEAINHIRLFCSEHNIDAEIQSNGWLWASNNSSQDRAWRETLDASSAYDDSPFVELDGDRATELAGAPVRGGVLDPTCVGLHPGKLVRGLLAAARSLGVAVYERSPVRGLEKSEHGSTTVRTLHGSVQADAIVLAINAWCTGIPELRKYLLTTASDTVVVQPRQPFDAASRANVSDAGRLLDYWRGLEDGKVLFGKAGLALGWRARGARTLYRPVPHPTHLLDHMARTVPALVGANVVSTWRAPVEYSISSLPFFGEVPGWRGVYFGTGYSGDGIGPAVIGAQILASLVSRSNDGLSQSFLTRLPSGRGLPPEPIRFVGGQFVKNALLRQDRRQDEERTVGTLTGLLTRIDPTSFVG